MISKLTKIDISQFKLVVFDLDGTLYNQKKMRKSMLLKLLSYYCLRPFRWFDLKIIDTFRKEREKLAFVNDLVNLQELQYQVCATKLNIEKEEVKKVIDYWLLHAALPLLHKWVYPEIREFLKDLKSNNISIAVWSDYAAVDKIKAMNIDADLIVAATDAQIDKLKPNTTGLSYILNYFNCPPEKALMIGDRDKLDGEAARRMGMQYFQVV